MVIIIMIIGGFIMLKGESFLVPEVEPLRTYLVYISNMNSANDGAKLLFKIENRCNVE